MQVIEKKVPSASSVNYEEAPLAELEIGEAVYRLDPDRGSSVAISRREPGSWRWAPVAEGRWDGSRLRARGLEPEVVGELGRALGEAMRDQGEQD